LGAFAGARDAPPPLPQVLTQTSICVNTRLADKNMTAEQLVGLLDADDDTVARTLVGAVGNVTGTEPYFQNVAKSANSLSRQRANGRFAPEFDDAVDPPEERSRRRDCQDDEDVRVEDNAVRFEFAGDGAPDGGLEYDHGHGVWDFGGFGIAPSGGGGGGGGGRGRGRGGARGGGGGSARGGGGGSVGSDDEEMAGGDRSEGSGSGGDGGGRGGARCDGSDGATRRVGQLGRGDVRCRPPPQHTTTPPPFFW